MEDGTGASNLVSFFFFFFFFYEVLCLGKDATILITLPIESSVNMQTIRTLWQKISTYWLFVHNLTR